MATMISEVYDAFRAAGTPEAQAREAAEALSAESLSTKGDIDAAKDELNRKIDDVEKRLNHSIYEVKQSIAVMRWMVALVLAVQVIPLLKSLLAI